MAAPQQDHVTGHVTNQRANRGPISGWTTWAGGQLGGLLPRTPVPSSHASRTVSAASSQSPAPPRRILDREMDPNPARMWQPRRSPKKEKFRPPVCALYRAGSAVRIEETRPLGLSRSKAPQPCSAFSPRRTVRQDRPPQFDVAAVTAKGDRGTGEEVVSRILYRCATGYGSTGGRVAVTVRS